MALVVAPLNMLCLLQDQRYEICRVVCDWERLEYGEGKHRIPPTLKHCIDKNDTGFICAMENDRLVGYADLWQLQRNFYELLLVGECTEEEICAGFILDHRTERSNCWYVGSIITEPGMRENRPVKAAQVFHKIFELIYGILLSSPVPARIMGVGSTPFGSRLMNRHGFQPIGASFKARDLRPRFEKTLEALTLEPA